MRATRSMWWGLAATLMTAMSVMWGCGNTGSDVRPTATAADASAPRRGGEIVIQYLEPASFDPHWSQFAEDIGVERMVWRGLYRLDKDQAPVPEMAASAPQVSADGKSYTVALKPGLKWSDGHPLTAQDFVAGIQRTCDPDNEGNYKDTISNIVGCDEYYSAKTGGAEEKARLRNAVGATAPDETTVVFTLENPQPTFQLVLSLWMTFPVPSHIVKAPGERWPAIETLAFNGPYRVERYTPKSSLVLVRNDNYAGAPPNLDRITMKYIDKLDAAENAYRANQVQLARANPTNLNVIKADPILGREYFQVPGVTTRGIHVNLTKKPLDDYRVRLALSQATDRDALNKAAFQGAYIPSTTWMPPTVAGGGVTEQSFADEIGYNPDRARMNLADAGFPGGKGFPTLTMLVNDTPDRRATADFIKDQWKKVLNINVEIEVVDSPTRSARFSSMAYDLLPGGWMQDYPDPENWVVGLFNSGGSNNHYGAASPQLDALLRMALFNTNDAERRSQYREINRMISADPMLAGPVLYQESFNYLAKTKLKGPRENANISDAYLAGDWNVESWYLAD